MKCFYVFKDKSRNQKGQANSAPELREQSKTNSSAMSRTAKSPPPLRSMPELYKEKEHNLRVFSFQELREATNGFLTGCLRSEKVAFGVRIRKQPDYRLRRSCSGCH